MRTVGYVPFRPTTRSTEADWLAEQLPLAVRLAGDAPSLNDGPPRPLPALRELRRAVRELLPLPTVVLEGPAGFVWAVVLRAHGFEGSVTVLPYVNPSRWWDVAAVALYRRVARPGDRILLGSGASAAFLRSLGVDASVGEPYGIDDAVFAPRPAAIETRRALGIPPGRLLLYAGRAQPDKDLYALLRVSVKARLLFGDLRLVVATHVFDEPYLAPAREQLESPGHLHLVVDPTREQLADLYTLADAFVTASTSHFETFGRAPAEALACGTRAIAPRYDGFPDVLAQPGGTLVDVELDAETGAPRVDDDALLRAVYDVLSDPAPPARREIAAAARRRLGRATTIDLLAHLARGVPRAAAPPVLPLSAELPDAWRVALHEFAGRDPRDALAWLLDGCDHEGHGRHDDAFRLQARRALCVPVRQADEGVRACR